MDQQPNLKSESGPAEVGRPKNTFSPETAHRSLEFGHWILLLYNL